MACWRPAAHDAAGDSSLTLCCAGFARLMHTYMTMYVPAGLPRLQQYLSALAGASDAISSEWYF